jgi:hypothetical protein
MTTARTNPIPDDKVHVELPPVQVRGWDRIFAILTETFDKPEGSDG